MKNDTTCYEYLAIKAQITALEKQLEPIKKQMIANGDYQSDLFSVEIQTIEQNRVCGADELLEKVGFVKVNELGLIKNSSYQKINAKQKLQMPNQKVG